MKKLLRALLLGGVAASLAVTVPLAACDVTVKDPCANGAHVDKDGNGICDNCTTPMPKPDECPNGGSHVDANGDGKCDKCGGDFSGSTVVPTPSNYTVTVKSLGNIPLKDVYVTLEDANGKKSSSTTNADGIAGFTVEPAAYTATLSNVPKGYSFEESYKTSGANKNFDIHLESSVIKEKAPQGTVYRAGDVLYDFTYTADNVTYQLSELLETRRAVILNFWATWCGPCKAEFPYLDAAYKSWQNKVQTDEAYAERGLEVLAISTYDGPPAVSQFKSSNGYQFPFMSDSEGVGNMFTYTGIPTTIVIDRYGVFSFIHSGGMNTETQWNELFDKYTADEYVAPTPSPEPDPDNPDTPERVEPDVPWPDLNEISSAVTQYDGRFTFNKDDDKYNWPWVVSEDKDGKLIYPSNTGHPNSYSILYIDFTLTQEDIDNGLTTVAFDFHAETEQDRDLLYIITDEKFVRAISGISEVDWETCYAHVFDTPGEHQIALCYQKDTSKNVGSDRVNIKNFRLMKEADVQHPFYVQREAATGERTQNAEVNTYEKYVSVVFNNEDGYYHVGSKNGPLLLANLMGKTQYSRENSFWTYVYLGHLVVDLDGDGVKEDLKEQGTYFANRAMDSDIENCFPVTELLMKYLNALAAKLATDAGIAINPKAWLEFCCYYAPYGTEKQLEDPIKGITTHSAIEAFADNPNTDIVEYTTVVINKLLNPRGFYYYFIPEVSGVYTVESFGKRIDLLDKVVESTEGLETAASILKDNGNFFSPDELIVSNDFNAQSGVDFKLSVYMEAGQKYYISTMFNTYEALAKFNMKITYDGESKDVWYHASTGYYTTTVDENGEPTNEIYLPSIEYIYDAEEDRFYHKLENGEKGNMIYIDFSRTSYFDSESALKQTVDYPDVVHAIASDGKYLTAPAFDFDTWDLLITLPDGSTSMGFQIEDFENNRETKIIAGVDYTDKMKEYRDKAVATETTATDDNLKGCLPANAELVNILQVYTMFYGIGTYMPNNWLMMAYYYEHIGAPDHE